MLSKIKKQINNSKAFTLVEALVAISILMIAIASPMTLVQKGLSTAILSKDQMIAAFLAQDAIEGIKNVRDQIAISQTTGDWLAGTGNLSLTPCVCNPSNNENCNFDILSGLKFCTVDTTTFPILIISNPNNATLKITKDNNGNFTKYDYSGPDTAKFSRYINIVKTNGLGGNEAVANVRVSWDSPQGSQKIDIQDFIYNYSENLKSL